MVLDQNASLVGSMQESYRVSFLLKLPFSTRDSFSPHLAMSGDVLVFAAGEGATSIQVEARDAANKYAPMHRTASTVKIIQAKLSVVPRWRNSGFGVDSTWVVFALCQTLF